jgi:hypothetical protein
MKKWIAAFLVLLLIGCDEQPAAPNVNISTVDSNVMGAPDSSYPTLYIDSHRVDTSFDIAMDSVVPDILADDTSYNRP